jgi:hypothetical protein
MANKLDIDKLIEIDDTGMPIPPNVRQLIDKDIRELYTRDKSKDKSKYIKECIVIYYLGDPKSPAKQAGLSDAEALKMAIEQADLSNSYLPDALVLRIIKRYYDQNIGEAGRTVENILKGIHNINLSIDTINQLLNEQLKTTTDLDTIDRVLNLVDQVNKKASELPGIVKKLNEAKENLMYEKEIELARGGNQVVSSMDAEAYIK